MRRFLLATLATATLSVAIAGPAVAQSRAEQSRWDSAQQRYDAETRLYQQERDRYYAASDRDRNRGGGYGYNGGGRTPPPGGWGETDYDAARYYRDDPRYQERTLSNADQVYQGSDGRQYCRRSDGTTGLIVGGALGGILGNVVDGGRHRTGGTLLGGALGALLGKSADQQNSQVRCR
ncbi:glycine zipper 2TM domain-containing protein [Sphingomonas naphthae]|uniref:17 kDa surface antigen n=1 Tax=Sphingomonas naphthae TaxID=1813468 RepID=A0ABY7TKR6_9SPHN|nr:glycine zipper 2TM domain-containing protein [Sphingomonas naphthae]WCT73831.1 glycine zipper 2TM domain-containing protein [Sphingomonas naphthae]